MIGRDIRLVAALLCMTRIFPLLLLTGCYFYYPKIRSEPRPTLVDDEEVSIASSDHEFTASCDPTKESRCGLSDSGLWKKKHTYTTVHATYAGRTLTQWELRRLVDPKFDDKLARVKSNKGVCNLALVPSVISVIGLATLAIAGPFYDKLGDKAATVGWGAAAAAAGGALLSYPMGGFACRRARRQYKEMFHGVDPTDTEFQLTFGGSEEKGSDTYVEEMLELTKSFNERFGKPAATTPSED